MEKIFPLPSQHYSVLVRCFTYNQEKYIEDALNGFVMQQTNFPFVCLIVDDASTDKEPEVIKSFLQRECETENAEYKEIGEAHIISVHHKKNSNCLMVVYLLKKNLYTQKEKKMALVKPWRDACKYEAMCEGDDYWTDPLKLQKQVDYLENHPKCGLIWAKARCYIQEKDEFKGTTGAYMKDYYDMFINYSIAPLTTMYRSSILPLYNEFIKGQHFMMGDSPLFLYIAHNHDIHFMDEIVGVYRVLRNSACHSDSYEKKVRFKNGTFEVVKFYYEKYGHPNFKQLESIHYSYLFNYAFNDARYQTAKEVYKQIAFPNVKIRIKRIIASLPIVRNLYFILFHKIIKKY